MRKHILKSFIAQAKAEYPREACALIVAQGRKQIYFPCVNIADEPGEEFKISPDQYGEAEQIGDVIGVIHSHPDATSKESPRDRAMCDAMGIPWHILSWPEGDYRTITPRGETPLLGRPFVHGALDCWQVCADWYKRQYGIEFEKFAREDKWWRQEEGPSLYERAYADAGFYRVDVPQRGDMIVMLCGRAFHPNHAGIFLGADPALPGEVSDVFGPGPFMLHHMQGRPSEIIVYGGPWRDRERMILRHRQVNPES